VHINGETAFLGFFPDNEGKRSPSVPDGMWSGDQSEVKFRLVGGGAGDLITVQWYQLIPLEGAYRAAVEFMRSPTLPKSVTWFEL
jgi:hypothetical protein